MIMEHKIGETIEFNEDTLRIAEQIGNYKNPCDQCYFEHHKCWLYHLESCAGSDREDKTNIIFVKVENQ